MLNGEVSPYALLNLLTLSFWQLFKMLCCGKCSKYAMKIRHFCVLEENNIAE